MKKYLMVPLLASLLLCTGCGKKLTCTLTHDDDDVSGTEKIVINFDKDNKTTDVEMIVEADFGKEYTADEVKEQADKMREAYEDEDDVYDVKITTKGTKMTIKYKMEVPKGEEKTYDEAKEYFEEDGYKCK